MWPFSKEENTAPRAPRPDDWVLGQGQRDGFPMIVRMADAYSGLAPIPAYDHHLIVSVHFRNPRQNGFPSSEESDNLDALETNFCRLLEIDNESLCVLVITNNGLRDFIFYTRNLASLRQRIEDARVMLEGFVVEFSIELDKEWRIYQHFSRWLASSGQPSA